MISNESIQRVYKQCFECDKLRVSSEIMMELLEEIAEYRYFRLKNLGCVSKTANFLRNFFGY